VSKRPPASKKPGEKAREFVEKGRQLFAESRSQLRSTFEQLRQTKEELGIVESRPPAQTATPMREVAALSLDETEPPPVATPTIARLYLRQGKLEHAERMFEQLAQSRPSDVKLAAELAQAREAIAATQKATHAPSDELKLKANGRELHCAWKISPQGSERGELVLGNPGSLVLRVAGFPANPTALPKDIPLNASSGARKITAPAGASLVAASVGLRGRDERFASIVHCAFVRLNETPA
jgi:hypothetical protein